MPNTQTINRHIKSVRGTKQITKAMELVAASKMKKSQTLAEASRAYAAMASDILVRIGQVTDVASHPLYKSRPLKKRLYVVITSDRGLAGAYNSNVLKFFTAELQKDKESNVVSQAILLGKKAAGFASRIEGLEVLAAYDRLDGSANGLSPIISTIFNEFEASNVDQVDVIYTSYKSTISQITSTLQLLPAAHTADQNTARESAIIEPSPSVVLEKATKRLLEAQFSQALLESLASEQSARMMAMKTASDNASELIDDLTLARNKARQAAITQELAEISGGVEALR